MAANGVVAHADNAKLFGKVLATAINTRTDQLSELQQQRLHHKLEMPDVLTGKAGGGDGLMGARSRANPKHIEFLLAVYLHQHQFTPNPAPWCSPPLPG